MLTALEIKGGLFALALATATGYHFVALHNAVSDARAEDKAQFESQVAKVNAEAKSDHDAQQAEIDRLAQSSQPEIAAKLTSLNAMLAKLKADATKPPIVFKPGCDMPQEQVVAYNSIK